MSVVRIKRPKEDFDYEMFSSKKGAVVRFQTARHEMIDGEIEQCTLFDAEASDAESAMAMVCRGKAHLVASDLSDDPNTPRTDDLNDPSSRNPAELSLNDRRSTR